MGSPKEERSVLQGRDKDLLGLRKDGDPETWMTYRRICERVQGEWWQKGRVLRSRLTWGRSGDPVHGTIGENVGEEVDEVVNSLVSELRHCGTKDRQGVDLMVEELLSLTEVEWVSCTGSETGVSYLRTTG